MKRIGIDRSTHDIYESANGFWHSVWPASPVVSVAERDRLLRRMDDASGGCSYSINIKVAHPEKC